jgi:hypothetical protein
MRNGAKYVCTKWWQKVAKVGLKVAKGDMEVKIDKMGLKSGKN